MEPTRRTVLALVAAGVTAGCPGDAATPPPTTDPTPTPAETCDPADVTRPPVIEDGGVAVRGYPTKPQALDATAVAGYLSNSETAYAWTRLLDEAGPVTRINVDTTTAWTPEAADTGFLAWSRIETSYTPQGSDDPQSDVYVANYYVSAGPVYRAETAEDSVDPRTRPDRVLVQCGEGGRA